MVVTKHAYKRFLERLGLNRKATERMLNKIWDKEISTEETTGRIKQRIDSLQVNAPRTLIFLRTHSQPPCLVKKVQ